MEIAALPDTFHVLAKHLVSDHLAVAAAGNLQISVLLSAIDATASTRGAIRRLVKRRLCRTRRRPCPSRGSEDAGLFSGGDDGSFGGSGGGGWNFDGFGGFGWDDSSSSPDDPAFDFVYEMVCWLVFSNCLYFAFKKIVRLVSQGLAGHGKKKVPIRLTSVC